MKKMVTLLLIFFSLYAQKPRNIRIKEVTPEASSGTQIVQENITWIFDKEYPYGQFANGDYWVAGDTVIITRIKPDFDGDQNGWEVDPVVEGTQGFSSDLSFFDETTVPKLPYKAVPGRSGLSIVKTIRSSVSGEPHNCFGCIKSAAVLTIVKTPPPDNGTKMFRPSYLGTKKRQYYLSDLKLDELPSYQKVSNMPSLDEIYDKFKRVQLDHKTAVTGRNLHPSDNMPDYGADIGKRNADAALRLMINDPISEKMKALIVYVQYGIDLFAMIEYGHTWPAGGGHNPGQKLPLAFAAILLGDDSIASAVKSSDFFHEDIESYFSKKANRALWGDDGSRSGSSLEKQYWYEVIYYVKNNKGTGYKQYKDPYELIDGGAQPGTSYQVCCSAQPWKGSATALLLMPSLIKAWGDTTNLMSYVRRWVNLGIWSQPDSCAPADAIDSHYGTLFGPDGNGGCIKDKDDSDGIGRFPSLHGTKTDGGGRYSDFQKAMWNAYVKK